MTRRVAFALVLALSTCAEPASSQAPSRPPVHCRSIGAQAISVGAAWSDKAITTFASVAAYAPAAGDNIATLVVVNTHATQTLYVLLRANAAEATSAAISIPAGASLSLDMWGAGVGTISLQGGGAATTGFAVACIGRP